MPAFVLYCCSVLGLFPREGGKDSLKNQGVLYVALHYEQQNSKQLHHIFPPFNGAFPLCRRHLVQCVWSGTFDATHDSESTFDWGCCPSTARA